MLATLSNVGTGLGALVAIAALVIAVRAARVGREIEVKQEQRQLALDARDHQQLALDLYEDLTCLEVQNAHMRAPSDPASKAYLRALTDRASISSEVLGAFLALDGRVQDMLRAEFTRLADVDPDADSDSAQVLAENSAMDRSTYTWDGASILTKHQVLQRLAQQFALDNALTARDDFISAFSDELETIDGLRGRPDSERLLTSDDGADPAHRRVLAKAGPLRLDDQDWVIANSLGYPSAGYAKRTQLPVIEHFIRKRYHVAKTG